LRIFDRDDTGEITEVPDGLVFPIIAAYSEFVKQTNNTWVLSPPKSLDESVLIQAAKDAYIEIASRKPEIMGKTKACYTQIQQLTAIYRKLS
jgi:hypothetical protein